MTDKYIVSMTDDGYIGTIGTGTNASQEIANFDEIDFEFLNAYRFDGNMAVLDENKKAEIIAEREQREQAEHQPSDAERIKALEDQLAAYEAAYAEGVNEA